MLIRGEKAQFIEYAKKGNLSGIQSLMQGLNVIQQNMLKVNNYLAFEYAAGNGHLDVMRQLWHWTPLSKRREMLFIGGGFLSAVMDGHIDVMRQIWDWIYTDAGRQTILQFGNCNLLQQATMSGNIEIIRQLWQWADEETRTKFSSNIITALPTLTVLADNPDNLELLVDIFSYISPESYEWIKRDLIQEAKFQFPEKFDKNVEEKKVKRKAADDKILAILNKVGIAERDQQSCCIFKALRYTANTIRVFGSDISFQTANISIQLNSDILCKIVKNYWSPLNWSYININKTMYNIIETIEDNNKEARNRGHAKYQAKNSQTHVESISEQKPEISLGK